MPVLYISRDNGTLGRQGEALVWRPGQGEPRQTLPSLQISGVVVMGLGNITTQALHLLMDAGIPVHYLSSNGQYKGTLISGYARGFRIRRTQYEAITSPEISLNIARQIIAGKIDNQRNTLLRALHRHKRGSKELCDACTLLKELVDLLPLCPDLEHIRGIEGQSAKTYFRSFGSLIEPPWSFSGRTRRPPKDAINAMLSFGYTLLLSSVVSAILTAGLDPCAGFIHPEYRGRPSLALDLMEEFRSSVVDRFVLGICSRKIFTPEDFQIVSGRGVNMAQDVKSRFVRLYANRLLLHAVNQNSGMRAPLGEHIRQQSGVFLRALQTGTEYQPFILGR